MSLLVSGATIIDGLADRPLLGQSIWMHGNRIGAIGSSYDLGTPAGAEILDARGKYVIPGLMNANVHLLADTHLETLARYSERYEELITEAAQVALKNGLTTVFDTGGPRRYLTAVRDQINHGKIPGSRIYCAGWIAGFDGPYSDDFHTKVSEVASSAFIRRINSIWVENVGRHLMWLAPEQVASEVRAYIAKGIDFLKYASNDHFPGAFLTFSPLTQTLMVEEAHRAGVTAQAHATSVEGLRIAIEAGCELIQHANITGPVPIPEATLDLLVRRGTGAVVFAHTEEALEELMKTGSDTVRTAWASTDINARNFIKWQAPLLLANDGLIFAPETRFSGIWGDFYSLSDGHFAWFRAMEQKGCPAMQMLKAATSNIAAAYGKDKDLGTLEEGKVADMVILDRNPLEGAQNYKSIYAVIKDGVRVNRDSLPLVPILTKPLETISEERFYVPFLKTGRFPPHCSRCGLR